MENSTKNIQVSPINKHSVLKEVRTNGSWRGFIAPNNVNHGNIAGGWHIGMEILIALGKDGEYYVISEYAQDYQLLNDCLNSFKYYNCNNELGQRIRFWGGVKMTYQEYIKDVFIEHHNCIGYDLEEALDSFNDSPFTHVEKWLTKIGYDLSEYYLMDEEIELLKCEACGKEGTEKEFENEQGLKECSWCESDVWLNIINMA